MEFVYDEKENVWVYTIEMPEEEKKALDDFCAERNITINDMFRSFLIWSIENPETAKQWLIQAAVELTERTHEDWMSRLMLQGDAQKEEDGEKATRELWGEGKINPPGKFGGGGLSQHVLQTKN